ncbi:zinc finger protein 280B-like [Mastomys coucha]|uniref:zinc finger protein 280B-like n=1 Tax=Mastomys coucha TaxID=35658 RepID=UPI001261E74E|nr:zinc finger protein 280B-like [Mastomys coucha]
MEQPFLLDDEEQDPEPQQRSQEPIQVLHEDGDDDAELIFVGVTSTSQTAKSNILNRVTLGSRLERKHDRLRPLLNDCSPAVPTAEAVIVLRASPAESRLTDSPIIIDPLSESDNKSNSPQVVPSSSSKCCSPLVTLSSSESSPVKAALSGGDVNENFYVSKCHFPINPQRPEHSLEIVEPFSSGTFHTLNVQQRTCFFGAPHSLNLLGNGVPPSEDSAHPRQDSGLAEADFSRRANQETFDPKKGSLTLLLSDFYYGQYKVGGRPEQKTYTTFKCPSCSKALKNVIFMSHTKHHLELERQGSEDACESHVTCLRCHQQFDSPFQLECHIDRVHTAPDPPMVCKICELSFETDQVLLQHMKDNHKPGEMPYVCQVCKYRSSVFADVETHFTKCHVNTKNLLCPFCLKIFKTEMPYMCHYRGHWERSGHQCSKCRLQFLTFKEKMEPKTQCHQMFKKPKQLEGLPPETMAVDQVSVKPVESESVKVASITVSTTDWEPSYPRSQGWLSPKPH